MNDPFTQSLAFAVAVAEDVEDGADAVPTAREAPSDAPPSQVRFGDPGPPANDAANTLATVEPTVDRTVLLRHLADPRLRRDLLSYLITKRGVTPDRADEVVQQTYLRALRAGKWPDEHSAIFAWMKSIAQRALADDRRKTDRRAEIEEPHEDVDVAEEPRDDEEARHVAEVAGIIAAESVRDAETLRMIQAQAEGEALTDILARGSISKDTFYRRKARFVSAVKKRLLAIASMTTAGLGLMLFLHAFIAVTFIGVGAAPHVPGAHDPLPALPSHEDARALRQRGFDHLRVGEYDRCLELLNRAQKLDPEGDRDPKVVSARRDAEKALREGAPARQP